jgi:short-subunit dehydrogenase
VALDDAGRPGRWRRVDYRNRVVIVTGASSGIGRQVALDFAARGASLVLAARRADRLAEVARDCERAGWKTEPVVGDVAADGFVEALVARAVERFGRLDVVVNNAGVPKHKQFFDVTADDVEHTLRVNLIAPARLIVAALPAMLRQGEGHLVNVSSVAGKLPPPREAVYAASKFGLTGLTEGLWLDLAGSNVHASVIHVGPIDTEIWQKTDEPTAFRGRKLPPSAVSAAIFRAIEHGLPEVWVPGRMRLAWWFRLLAPGLFRAGAARFDPVPAEAIAAARRRAAGA